MTHPYNSGGQVIYRTEPPVHPSFRPTIHRPIAIAPPTQIHYEWRGQVVPPWHSISHPSSHSKRSPKTAQNTKPREAGSPGNSSKSSLSLLPPASGGSSDSLWLNASDWPALGSSSAASPTEVDEKTMPSSPPSSKPEHTALDRYAPAYQPAWIRNLPPVSHVLYLDLALPFPDLRYAPPTLVQPSQVPFQLGRGDVSRSILSAPPADSTSAILPLNDTLAVEKPGSYANHFSELLSLQLLSLVQEAENATLYTEHLTSIRRESKSEQFSLVIPAIREDMPQLFSGDRLFLRPLNVGLQRDAGPSIEAEITGLLKRDGKVFLRSPHLEPMVRYVRSLGIDNVKVLYQISFKANAGPICAMQDAVTRLDRAMRHSNAIARRWLFPQLEGASNPAQTLSHSPWDPSTLDATLNEEQMSAAIAIASRSHTIPYLISGPPGTGKTKTLVASILSILQVNPHAHIIACAPSNPAADTIVSRLIPRMNANQLLRLNPPNRTFAEVPDDVLRYCHVEGDAFGLPCYAKLMAFQVVVTTCQDAEILIRARATNLDTMATELAHGELFHPDQPLNILPHWTHLLVDEAGQASEPEIAIPLSVLLPPPTSLTSISDPVVVLCGDVHQLGPRVLSVAARTGELDVSLLERLFERPVYASHPMSRTSIRHRRANGASGASGAPGPPPFCDLVRNYRSLPEILMIPSTLFYEDTLVPAARDVGHLAWEGLPNPAMPIAFLGCDSEENWIEEGASWYNLGEIRMVVETVGSLLGNVPDLRQEQIAIITPWREQVWRLRAALRKATFFKVDVGNVENYQGREFRVTILSTVRGSKRFIQSDHQANMGVIFERKRFNVAITRAKDLLVIIGNAACLSLDPFWNQFLQFCLRNGLYKGPETGIKDTGACMSRLEIEMRMRNESDLDEEKNLTIANAVASLALETR